MFCVKKNDSKMNDFKFEMILFNMGFYLFMLFDFFIFFVYRFLFFFKNNFREFFIVIG